jgi:hypothetical protein
MRWALWIIITLCTLLGIYITSPLIALQRIASAVETRDACANRTKNRQLDEIANAHRYLSLHPVFREEWLALRHWPPIGCEPNMLILSHVFDYGLDISTFGRRWSTLTDPFISFSRLRSSPIF